NFITRMGGRKRAGRIYLLESECGGNRERGHDQRSPREQREGAARLQIERRIPVELRLAEPPLFQFDRRIGAELTLFAFAFVPEDFQRMLARQTTAKSPRARRTPLPRRRGAAALKLLDPSREDQPGRIEPDRYALAGGFLSACGRILERRLARGLARDLVGGGLGVQFDFQEQICAVVFQSEKVRADLNHIPIGEWTLSDVFSI